jgi:hypothetical protein
MKRPDAVFTITINPRFYVTGCAEKNAQEERGVFGCHQYTTCPNCKVTSDGYEFWGENGHKQGSADDHGHMRYWVGLKARHQWRMQDGGIMGYRFRKGGNIYYIG